MTKWLARRPAASDWAPAPAPLRAGPRRLTLPSARSSSPPRGLAARPPRSPETAMTAHAKPPQAEPASLPHDVARILAGFGVAPAAFQGGSRPVRTPLTGEILGHVHDATPAEIDAAIGRAASAFEAWRTVPAPQR